MDESITRNPGSGFTFVAMWEEAPESLQAGIYWENYHSRRGKTCIFETALTCADGLSKTEVSI